MTGVNTFGRLRKHDVAWRLESKPTSKGIGIETDVQGT